MSMSLFNPSLSLFDQHFFDSSPNMMRFLEPHGSGNRMTTWQPRTNISETDNKYKISVEVPGAKKEDVNIELDGQRLQISGKIEQESREDNETMHRYERVYGSFSRSFSLPDDANPDAIKGSFVNGVLMVDIDKKQIEQKAQKTKKIELK